MPTPTLTLSPKATFTSDRPAAAAHSDTMASPAFQRAAMVALVQYQYECGANDPTLLAVVASRLQGAREYLRILMNLGIEQVASEHPTDWQLEPPEKSLNRPFTATE